MKHGICAWRNDSATYIGGVDRVMVGLATATCGVTLRELHIEIDLKG